MFAVVQASKILIIEDSAEVVSLLERVLGEQGYDVTAAMDGESGLARALEQQPDLVILDLGLPGRDGIQVAIELRRRGLTAPVLMLTARGAVADRVSGLEAGADDYLGKPFDAEELLARVRALLRRSLRVVVRAGAIATRLSYVPPSIRVGHNMSLLGHGLLHFPM